jgi:hypothetical protein
MSDRILRISPLLAAVFARKWSASYLVALIEPFLLLSGEKWKVWRNVHGQTSSIRNHLKEEHETLWRDVVVLEKLKGWKDIGNSPTYSEPGRAHNEKFTIEGFYERLLRWIAVDDQVTFHSK